MRYCVTGGAGFIGSNFIRYLLTKYPDAFVVNYDALTYAGNRKNLQEYKKDPRYVFVHGDVCDAKKVRETLTRHPVDVMVNFAAESHVDRSIAEPGAFIETDVKGTYVLLEAVKEMGIQKYLQISTDEVYGDREHRTAAKETDMLEPSSPYAASKAAADLLVLAYRRTYSLPVMISRCTNNFGPYQYPEKLLPLMITNILEGAKIPVYGDGGQIRDWLYVQDHCEAIDCILTRGTVGNVYNVSAGASPEITNIELVHRVLRDMDKDESQITHVKDRPGHDRRYALDSSLLRSLGWSPKHTFETGLAQTIAWYQEHDAWWKEIKSGEFREYYTKQYGA